MNSSAVPVFTVALESVTMSGKEMFYVAFTKNFVVMALGLSINYINSMLVFTFSRHHEFRNNPRYILYIHMVFNDILQLSTSVILHVSTYAWPQMHASFCAILVLIASFTSMNTPLNLAGMAVERYIAICNPLRHAQICTVQRTYVLIALIWSLGAIPGLADFILALLYKPLEHFNSHLRCFLENIFGSPYHAVNITSTNALYMSFVWMTLMYTYLRVLFTARSASTDPVSARKARNTILLHGAQLMLCMLAYIFPSVDMTLRFYFPQYRVHIMFFSYIIAYIFPRFLSPIIYGIRDNKFKKQLGRYLSCGLMTIQMKPTD